MNIVTDTFPLAVVIGTPIMPAVGRGSPFGEPFATLVAKKFAGITGVPMEFELEFRCKCPVAVPAGMRHGCGFLLGLFRYGGLFTSDQGSGAVSVPRLVSMDIRPGSRRKATELSLSVAELPVRNCTDVDQRA
jgi:hypothetical protein